MDDLTFEKIIYIMYKNSVETKWFILLINIQLIHHGQMNKNASKSLLL